MARDKPTRTRAPNKRVSWKKIAEEAIVDAHGEYEQVGAWQTYLEDRVRLPCRCRVDRKKGTLTGFDVTEHGTDLLALINVDGNKYKVDATTVTILDKESSRYLEAFKKWL